MSQPIHVSGDVLASPGLGLGLWVLGWSWFGVSSKGGVGGWVRDRDPGLVQISEPTASEHRDLSLLI